MKKIKFLLFLATFIFSISHLYAFMMLQLNLEQLTALSERVFSGKCISNVPKKDEEGRSIQEVTYQVIEMLKGDPVDQITFKQLDSASVGKKKVGNLTLHSLDLDLPQYKVGEESIIFLSADGPIGLTAPIGLQQGKFLVKKSVSGEKRVVNGINNKGLFMGSSKSPKIKSMSLDRGEKSLLNSQSGDVGYADFISLVKKIATP